MGDKYIIQVLLLFIGRPVQVNPALDSISPPALITHHPFVQCAIDAVVFAALCTLKILPSHDCCQHVRVLRLLG